MSWRLTIPNIPAASFPQTVEMEKERAKGDLSRLGATHAADLAGEAAKTIVATWDVAQVPTRTFGAVLSGHANPNGEAPAGWGNDEIEVHVWRSGDLIAGTIISYAAKAPKETATTTSTASSAKVTPTPSPPVTTTGSPPAKPSTPPAKS